MMVGRQQGTTGEGALRLSSAPGAGEQPS